MQEKGQTLADLPSEVQDKARPERAECWSRWALAMWFFLAGVPKSSTCRLCLGNPEAPRKPATTYHFHVSSMIETWGGRVGSYSCRGVWGVIGSSFSLLMVFFHGFSIGCPWVFHWMITLQYIAYLASHCKAACFSCATVMEPHRWKESCKSSCSRRARSMVAKTPHVLIWRSFGVVDVQ